MLNSRQLTLRKSLNYSIRLLFWLPVIYFSLLLVRNTIPYFSFSQNFSFIEERILLFGKPIYKISFYTHIFAGMICISAALIQFSSYILKKRKMIHVISGKIYVMVVLMIGAPTGFYMAFFAKGSYWERSLFMCMAIYWFYSTAKGFQTILKKNVIAHKIWMIRSYCMAMTAVTFRIFHLVFYYMNWDHMKNYELSLWISVLGNILIAEVIIWNGNRAYMKKFLKRDSWSQFLKFQFVKSK